jgi:hypothetical protein
LSSGKTVIKSFWGLIFSHCGEVNHSQITGIVSFLKLLPMEKTPSISKRVWW